MTDVEPRFKAQDSCGCGCGAFGTLKRPWRDGSQCVARRCSCKRCIGRQSAKRGRGKQSTAATILGIPRSTMHPGHEEHYAGALRVEVKSGKRDTGPAFTAYLRCETQSEASRPVGDHRPFAAVLMPEGTSDGLFQCRMSKLPDVVTALVENWSAA
jgi:hypothetical protein